MDLNKRNGQPNKPRRDLIVTLRRELATGQPEVIEQNEYMAHGSRCEPFARAEYEFLRDCVCVVPAFIVHPTLPHIGYSPDGLVGDDGIIEIKCPALEPRHTRTVESKRCPDDYMPQVQGGMWITGRQWADFISYFPPLPTEIVRVARDEAFINRLASECADVWAQVIAQETAA
jgi:hypothetical protein